MLTANANSHLQKYKKKKIGHENKTNKITGTTTTRDTVIDDLLDRNMILIPIAIDPFGHFGPILQTFLFGVGEGGSGGNSALWGMRTAATPVDSINVGIAILVAIVAVVIVSRDAAGEDGAGKAASPLSSSLSRQRCT